MMTRLTVQDVACTLILQNPSMTADQLATLVKIKLPRCNCSANSIAWYRSKLRKGEIRGFSSSNILTYSTVSRKKTKDLAWPEWSLPSDNELLQLAKMTTRYLCFLHPDIIRSVVKDTEDRREEWSDRLKKRGIDPALYLWQHSPCASNSTTTTILNIFGALSFRESASRSTGRLVILLHTLLTIKIMATEGKTRLKMMVDMKSPCRLFLAYIPVLQIQSICQMA